ncbi:MAG: bifunctional ADP-dependent NAD(P)H-hydrate dehydratase/NAD(P)H-hydrate epimerase, partial [Clostridiales bacterium]|nr:bifunctional ADP-dependent NAD(P)H-hydrate dehydratase/NAD(P)H-hydrate epimerase [Clostridiales bacterium]
MKLVTASEMKAIERIAIDSYGIPGIVLMEHAGKSIAQKCISLLNLKYHSKKILVFAGKGNNGGDGFVAARHLINEGIHVDTILLSNP